jgi:release factor glutamine methyltransferase
MPPTWRELLADAAVRLGSHGDARRIVEEVSGWEGAELVLHLDDGSTPLTQARWSQLVERRAGGEPLQYVLGRWGFRELDLFVDRRVLIPRPETEEVVSVALEALDAMGPGARVAVDLGTGSGAIALSLAVERRGLAVWGVERSERALEVSRANLAGIGAAATRVRLVQGDWFEGLPGDLKGAVDLVVANPPYVGASEVLPEEVRAWEPSDALVAGPTGLESIEVIVASAPQWLRPEGALVIEIGETQGDAVAALAVAAGFAHIEVRPDVNGRPRALLARSG